MAGVKTVIVSTLPDNIPHAVFPCNGVEGSGESATSSHHGLERRRI